MSLKKVERINVVNLKKIIANISTLDITSTSGNNDSLDGIETILRRYLKKASKQGIIKVTYNQKNKR